MTDADQYCNICEEFVYSVDEYDKDKWDSLSDFMNEHPNIGLWSEGYGDYPDVVCMGCITYAYETKYGVPLRRRLNKKLMHLRWWIRRKFNALHRKTK